MKGVNGIGIAGVQLPKSSPSHIYKGLESNSAVSHNHKLLIVFNDTLKGLTIFVDKKNYDGTYENIFIKDEGKLLTKVSNESSTIFAKNGYVDENEKTLVLLNGSIQKMEADRSVSIVKFEKTSLNLTGLSTKSISEAKIQETSTIQIIQCVNQSKRSLRNCRNDDGTLGKAGNESKDLKIEINKRFGMPMFIPLISLISCFLLSIKIGRASCRERV